jgi:hypothetical protein
MSPDPTRSQNTVPTGGPPRDRQGACIALGCGQRTNMMDLSSDLVVMVAPTRSQTTSSLLLYDWPYVGASGGLAISGSERHAICCSTDVQSGLSDSQSKESKQIPPRFAAERRAQTTKLFDILTKRSRSSAHPCRPFCLSNLATARCFSARNCI